MRNKINIIIVAWMFFFYLTAAGCVYVPKAVPDEKDERCRLKTRSLTLDVYNMTPEYTAAANDMHQLIQEDTSEVEGLLIVLLAPVVISAGSLIVSGSIIVAGNTVHWIEAQGRCGDSATNKAVSGLVESTKMYGGQVVETCGQMIDWLEEQISMGEEYEMIDFEGRH